jgi:hypothetical protein
MCVDARGGWARCLTFRGIELDLLALEGLMFALVDYRTGSPVYAAMAAWIVAAALAAARAHLGRRNIAHTRRLWTRGSWGEGG